MINTSLVYFVYFVFDGSIHLQSPKMNSQSSAWAAR